ncbi:MAG: hypothetical protein QOJ20_5772 [Mycobacterium sp.]|jgi:hypothetical protein|nr:hypothetical protein [Mycobacterium sp.]MDT5284577.1 hypothetical protein [Mycobacterium sp.]
MFPEGTLAVTSAAGDAYRPADRGKRRNRHQLLTLARRADADIVTVPA